MLKGHLLRTKAKEKLASLKALQDDETNDLTGKKNARTSDTLGELLENSNKPQLKRACNEISQRSSDVLSQEFQYG